MKLNHIFKRSIKKLFFYREEKEKNVQKKLQERIKELNGIYSLGLLTEKYSDLDKIYGEFVKQVAPRSMEYPDKVFVFLKIYDQTYSNIENCDISKYKKYLSAKIVVLKEVIGELIVSYKGQIFFNKNFEKKLIFAYAERISKITERINKEKEITKQNKVYSELNKKHEKQNKELQIAKERAEESEEIFIQFMKHSPIYVFFKDSEMRNIRLSNNYKNILGMPIEEAIGKTMFDLFPSEFSKTIVQDDKNVLSSGEVYQIEEEFEGKYYSTIKFPVLIRENLQYLAGFTIDITERKKSQLALIENQSVLKKSNVTKDNFFSIIAHDLKNPFNVLLGFSNMLNDNYDEINPEKQKEIIKSILQTSENTYALLENLLLWAITQKGDIRFNPKKNNLHLLVCEIIELFEELINRKRIKFINQISKNFYVIADKDMFLTIIRNLILNAIKFTPKDGEIIVEAKKNNQFTKIIVTDTGIGISKEVQNNLFDISVGSSTEGTENEKGSGLGLILCKEFVEKHGGKIWVESELGKGSSFYFTIPFKTNE
ncbi:MAG: PAS domain-containing sensor histidine kinase [Bacteroidetes bacterium]|nr:PAS domain-containing sensor histidine kinase [Bacteroidota bacterium]